MPQQIQKSAPQSQSSWISTVTQSLAQAFAYLLRNSSRFLMCGDNMQLQQSIVTEADLKW